MSEIRKALNLAMSDICKIGIGKRLRNQVQNYNFRGIDDAMTELSPILCRHGITLDSKYSDLNITERFKGDPAEGKATRFATVKGSFTFHAHDGSSAVGEAFGEAMDSGDKALSKAQSVALRTVLFQMFMVPLIGMDPEADPNADEQEPEELDGARSASLEGSASLEKWWKAQTKEVRILLGSYLPSLKDAASKADKESV